MGTLSVDKILKTSQGAAEFTLPATDGTAGQSMITDGSGQLSLGNITVPANAVTTTKIIDNAVTGAKIAMGSDAAGDVLYYNGTDYVRLGAGTASQTLKMNSGATAPEWVTVAAGDNTPSFRANMSANQNITTNTQTILAFDIEVWDTDNAFNTTNYTFTVPAGEAGKYLFTGFARFDGTGMNNIQWRWIVNAAAVDGESAFTQTLKTVSDFTGFGVSAFPYIANLAAGDTIHAQIFASTGSSLIVKPGTSPSAYRSTSISGFKLIGV